MSRAGTRRRRGDGSPGPAGLFPARSSAKISGQGAGVMDRREMLAWTAAALRGAESPSGPSAAKPQLALQKELPVAATGSDVGSLFPFIRSQAIRGDARLAFT